MSLSLSSDQKFQQLPMVLLFLKYDQRYSHKSNRFLLSVSEWVVRFHTRKLQCTLKLSAADLSVVQPSDLICLDLVLRFSIAVPDILSFQYLMP